VDAHHARVAVGNSLVIRVAYFKYSLQLEVRAKAHSFLKLTLRESHLHIAEYGVASLDGF